MRIALVFPLVFALSALCANAFAQAEGTAESHFQSGVAALQKNDLKNARASFQDSLALDPKQAVTLFNLGVTEQRAGKSGLAMGLWRKALAIAPEFRPARNALDWTKNKLERSDIPHEVETWESLHDAALSTTTLEKYMVVCAVFFFATGWLALAYTGKRRRAFLDEKPLPGFPVVALVMGLGFLVTAFLTIAKMIDMQEIRGTVVAKKIEARSTPEKTGTPLFDLYEGLEVVLRQTRGDWAQVTYPGGATGWIPRDSLFTVIDDVVKK